MNITEDTANIEAAMRRSVRNELVALTVGKHFNGVFQAGDDPNWLLAGGLRDEISPYTLKTILDAVNSVKASSGLTADEVKQALRELLLEGIEP